MDDLKPYQVIMVDELKINDAIHYNCRAFFIRYLKNNRCMVQINGTLINIPVSKLRKSPDDKI
jgi:hypothetical protein